MPRQNICPNPACGTDVTGWTGGSVPAQVGGLAGFPVSTGARYTSGTFMQTPAAPTGLVVPGGTYTLSMYVKNNAGADFLNKTLFLAWKRSAGGDDFSTTTIVNLPNGALTRIEITGVAIALANSAYLVLDSVNSAVGSGFDCSAVLYEAAAGPAGTYFDGNSANASWDGTPNNSTSTLADTSGVIPDSVNIPITLGAPAVSLPPVTPDSVNIPITLGDPIVGTLVIPDSVNIPITLGTPEVGPTVSTTKGSWWTLVDIARENREWAEQERARGPVACPNDGEPLRRDPKGRLRCPFDGWTYQGQQ